MYLLVNSKIYEDDLKKIAFMLSYINDGDAASWKEQLVEETFNLAIRQNLPPDFGTFNNFLAELKQAFEPYDSPGDALEELKELQMGNTPIDKHIAQYKMLVTKSKLKNDNSVVIDMF